MLRARCHAPESSNLGGLAAWWFLFRLFRRVNQAQARPRARKAATPAGRSAGCRSCRFPAGKSAESAALPAARAAHGDKPLPLAAALRLDHGALAALLVLTPTTTTIKAIRTILEAHNPKEEGPEGIYSQCENLPGFNSGVILERLRNAQAVAMNDYVDSPIAVASARNAVVRAAGTCRTGLHVWLVQRREN